MVTMLFSFTAGGSSIITLRSYSYAGGIQANGNVVSAGGFDPILALFDSAGNFIDQNDDGNSTIIPTDPNTGSFFDTELSVNLTAGDYTVAIMQFDNFAAGPTLSDGFTITGNAFFTAALGGCSNGQFCDVSGVDPFNLEKSVESRKYAQLLDSYSYMKKCVITLLGVSAVKPWSGWR